MAEIGNAKHFLRVAVALAQLMLQVKDASLILVEAQQKFRLERLDLPAEFGANGSRRSGHHDHAAVDMLAHRFQIEIDGDSPQQIGQGNFPNLLQNDSAGDQFRQFGTVRKGTPASLPMVTRRRIWVCVADGIAIRSSSILCS